MNMNFFDQRLRSSLAVAGVITFFVAAWPASAEHRQNVKPVYEVDNSLFPPPNPMLTPIEGSWARLFRQPDRIIVQAKITELNPDWAYNLHVWSFNNPAACLVTPPYDALGSRCTPTVDQGPAAESSLISLGGFIPDRFGVLNVTVSVRIGEGLPVAGFFGTNGSFTNVVNGPGLTNPMGAEIQLDLARKGPVQKDATADQFQTMLGACGAGFTLPPLNPNQLCEVVRESRVGGVLK